MANSQGFWSYVHADDEAEGERITRLARDVVAQFELLTGETISLFLDRDAIKWGEDWHDKIDSSLASVAFFVPVMTPRYFMSPECRRELQFFARRATRLGIKELVLPLLYVDVPALHDETSKDDLVTLVRTFQWEDWQELRFADVSSEAYRKGVARLAARIVEANKQVEKTSIVAIAQASEIFDGTGDDSPGFLDQIASAEEALPKLEETIETIGREIVLIGQTMKNATEEIRQGDEQAKGVATRLLTARKVARQLEEPAERVWSRGNEFVSQLHTLDEGFRAIIDRAIVEVEQDADAKSGICTFFNAVRSLAVAAHEGLDAVEGMITAIEPIEKLSRDLRPVLRRLRQGLTTMVEGREIGDEWVKLIDDSGIVCDNDSAS
ncbi:MAG TPA: toll/interleukin-1 receptor domain-containing protein [Thermoanaerobaculia bacterium]|nr:toll/interleukin-1 receptor domain-containing protein [Thermoanaerobaculia bacterium]